MDGAQAEAHRNLMPAGQWHDLAKLLPKLARVGIDTLAVEQATGLERPEQNTLVVAASVIGWSWSIYLASLHQRWSAFM